MLIDTFQIKHQTIFRFSIFPLKLTVLTFYNDLQQMV